MLAGFCRRAETCWHWLGPLSPPRGSRAGTRSPLHPRKLQEDKLHIMKEASGGRVCGGKQEVALEHPEDRGHLRPTALGWSCIMVAVGEFVYKLTGGKKAETVNHLPRTGQLALRDGTDQGPHWLHALGARCRWRLSPPSPHSLSIHCGSPKADRRFPIQHSSIPGPFPPWRLTH